MSNHRFLVVGLLIFLITLCRSLSLAASDPLWLFQTGGSLPPITAIGSSFGVLPNASDGYDVSLDLQTPSVVAPGVARMLIYHENGSGWSGPTGFYYDDEHAPIGSSRTSTTWDNIYLWAQGSWAYGNTVRYVFAAYNHAPAYYSARLYLDYVPQAAGWTGPMSFDLSPTSDVWVELPIVAVSNPLDGVRMHFTVMAPEPSSVLALGLPVIGLAGMLLRRRRR